VLGPSTSRPHLGVVVASRSNLPFRCSSGPQGNGRPSSSITRGSYAAGPAAGSAYLQQRGLSGCSVGSPRFPRAVASGRYDGYLRRTARAVAAFRCPLVLSLGHEMNGSWYSWGFTHTTPAVFIAAWRHVHDVFARAGHATSSGHGRDQAGCRRVTYSGLVARGSVTSTGSVSTVLPETALHIPRVPRHVEDRARAQEAGLLCRDGRFTKTARAPADR